MPISGTGRTRRDRGLTLVELLAVVAILAVLALPATLRWARSAPDPAAAAAARLMAEVEAARDRAMLGRRSEGFEGRPDGWVWDGGAAVAIDGLAADWRPEGPIRLAPDRSGTPFEVRLVAGGAARLCRFAGGGAMSCDPG